MAVAAGDGSAGSSISRPKRPKTPTGSSLPKTSSVQNIFGPTTAPTYKSSYVPKKTTRNPTSSVTNQPNERAIFSAIQSLLERSKPSPPSNAGFIQNNFPRPELIGRDNPVTEPERPSPVGQQSEPITYDNLARTLGHGSPLMYDNLARTLGHGEDSPAVSMDEIKRRVMRRLSNRGGRGMVNPGSPLDAFQMGPGYENDFGMRTHPVRGDHSMHTGDDQSAPQGTPIYAPVGGVVTTAASTSGAYGNQIVLDHGNSEQTMYGHLANIAVQPGQKVRKGDVIGYVGGERGSPGAGLSTGSHLHYETWLDGEAIDPTAPYNRVADETVMDKAIQKWVKNHEGQADQQEVVDFISQGNYNPYDQSQARQYSPQQADPILQGGQLAQNPQLNALMQAIREQESGGDYSVQNDIGARGAYQIMPSNIDPVGGWDMEALGREIDGQTFLSSPVLQNKIAKFKLKDYFKKYGAAGAAKAWYAGPGNADLNSDAPQYGGPSVNDYSDSVLRLMSKYLNQSQG